MYAASISEAVAAVMKRAWWKWSVSICASTPSHSLPSGPKNQRNWRHLLSPTRVSIWDMEHKSFKGRVVFIGSRSLAEVATARDMSAASQSET